MWVCQKLRLKASTQSWRCRWQAVKYHCKKGPGSAAQGIKPVQTKRYESRNWNSHPMSLAPYPAPCIQKKPSIMPSVRCRNCCCSRSSYFHLASHAGGAHELELRVLQCVGEAYTRNSSLKPFPWRTRANSRALASGFNRFRDSMVRKCFGSKPGLRWAEYLKISVAS